MRPSSYNIVLQVDSEIGRYALINSYTHAFDIVNQDVYQYLKTGGTGADISDNTKEKLVKRGYMTSLSKEEELELVKRLLDKMYDKTRLNDFGFLFIISYDCNLRCVYCYEDPILNGCACLPKNKLTKSQVDKAYEIIVEKDKNRGGKKNIGLYGGEPFLASNREMVEYIVEKGKQLGYSFTVTSNGYDIDKYFDYIDKNKIFSFQITIDGVEDIQNTRKPHFKNKDSFAKITSNVDTLLKMGIPVSIRINTDPYTMGRIEELWNFFKEKGWDKYEHFKSYCALLRKDIPMMSEDESSEAMFTQSSFYENFSDKQLANISSNKMTCQDYRVKMVLTNLLLGKHVPYKSCFCAAQTGCLIFDPLGDIYSCWDVVGDRNNRVGQYIPEFKLEEDLADKWFNSRVSEYKCAKCKYVFFCGGGCLGGSYRANGKIQPGDCNNYPQLFNYVLRQFYNEQIKKNFDEREREVENQTSVV